MTTKTILTESPQLTQQSINDIISTLLHGREIVGAYGESGGVSCPYCGCRQYPKRNGADKCLDCGGIYLMPGVR